MEAVVKWMAENKWVAEKMLQRGDLSAEADRVSLQPPHYQENKHLPSGGVHRRLHFLSRASQEGKEKNKSSLGSCFSRLHSVMLCPWALVPRSYVNVRTKFTYVVFI